MAPGFCLFVLDTATILSRQLPFWRKITVHGFPEARDNKHLFDHLLDRFNHRVDRYNLPRSEICSAFGSVNTLADWSTSKSDIGTVANSHSYS